MDDILILPLKNPNTPEVYGVMAKAYTGNPAHIEIFGKDNVTSNDLFFRKIMQRIQSDLFVAESEGRIVGIIGIETHPVPEALKCDPPQFTAEALAAPQSTIDRLKERQVIWDAMEPVAPHYHFGPVAVLPEYQGKGIGSRMMAHCCGILDREEEAGYLETESLANFRFYSRFGFQVIREILLFGIPNYFMERRPKPAPH